MPVYHKKNAVDTQSSLNVFHFERSCRVGNDLIADFISTLRGTCSSRFVVDFSNHGALVTITLLRAQCPWWTTVSWNEQIRSTKRGENCEEGGGDVHCFPSCQQLLQHMTTAIRMCASHTHTKSGPGSSFPLFSHSAMLILTSWKLNLKATWK